MESKKLNIFVVSKSCITFNLSIWFQKFSSGGGSSSSSSSSLFVPFHPVFGGCIITQSSLCPLLFQLLCNHMQFNAWGDLINMYLNTVSSNVMQGSSTPPYSDFYHGPKTSYPGRFFMVFLCPSRQLLILSNNCFLPHCSQVLVMNSCTDISSNMYLTCNYSNFKYYCYCTLGVCKLTSLKRISETL